ncbi:hypothetical protein HS088_TW07G00085 [Tripterygium wilfordii]|uniref:Uncharacterized protein n=1 Tax=Tripterygium wilfordii TaxID=458696 RepID=A0A7J7DDW7_TRIWF|nr:hypothetical protein HS088_TW07G00085 [Tripterygium wilfordii]
MDFAGTIVHLVGVITGLRGSLIEGPRVDRFGAFGKSVQMRGHNSQGNAGCAWNNGTVVVRLAGYLDVDYWWATGMRWMGAMDFLVGLLPLGPLHWAAIAGGRSFLGLVWVQYIGL